MNPDVVLADSQEPLEAVIKGEVLRMYQEVAEHPEAEFHFHHGREAAEMFGYEAEWLDRAPAGAVPVVFHSAVMAYLDRTQRRVFQDLVSGLVAEGRCHWVSNEAKGVLPEVTATGPDVPASLATFVLGVDGQAVAWTHGHGSSMTWLDRSPEAR